MNRPVQALLAATLVLLPAAAFATNVPLPVEGATMNIAPYLQTQGLFTENGTPSGSETSFDLYMRRVRLLINGDIGNNFTYLFQIDNANFGKFGNYTGRVIVQDAWVGWAPTGRKADTVIFIDAGIIYYPFSRLTITSAANQPTVEGHPDLGRGFNSTAFIASRNTGIGFRGWTLGKKIGFRGAVLEGVTPTINAALNNKRHPAVGLFANFDILGSEEGAWLYQSIYFGKDPILSISVAGTFQRDAILVPKGPADQQSLTSTLFLDYPLSEQHEAVLILSGYKYKNGFGSRDTGTGFSVDAGFRYQFVRPYVAWEYFDSDDCTVDTGAPVAWCAQAHTADTRNFRAGLDFYFNKTQNHLMAEFSLNRGQSSWGQQSVPGAAPNAANPLPLTSLGRTPSKSLLLHWSFIF